MTILQSPVGVRSIVTCLVAFFILASSIVFLLDNGQEVQVVQMAVEHRHRQVQVKVEARLQEPAMGGTSTEAEDTREEQCNWSRGRWVYDDVSRPLYSGLKCAFIFREVACDKFGRKDVMYQHWRWQPHGCDLPRYEVSDFAQFCYCQSETRNVPAYLKMWSVSIRVQKRNPKG
jgi:hypothetical protein